MCMSVCALVCAHTTRVKQLWTHSLLGDIGTWCKMDLKNVLMADWCWCIAVIAHYHHHHHHDLRRHSDSRSCGRRCIPFGTISDLAAGGTPKGRNTAAETLWWAQRFVGKYYGTRTGWWCGHRQEAARMRQHTHTFIYIVDLFGLWFFCCCIGQNRGRFGSNVKTRGRRCLWCSKAAVGN